jgi:hypothetical protein
MGFPDWTLWGMGISAIAALIALALSLLGQSPQFLRRSGLGGARLDMRVRTFTGFAFAFLLLAFGFFVAGVPIGDQPTGTTSTQVSNTAITDLPAPAPVSMESVEATSNNPQGAASATRATPVTGSFDGPPLSSADAQQRQTDEAAEITTPVEQSGSAPQESATSPASATSAFTPSPGATSTPPPTPTLTPTPSLTPTPVLGETTVVESQGSTVWLRRSPGGQNLVLVHDGDLVFVLNGHANKGGIFWSEIRTLEGVVGWLQEDLLLLDE